MVTDQSYLFHIVNNQDANGKPLGFKWHTYNETWEMIQNFASGLYHEDLVPKMDDVWFIYLFSTSTVSLVFMLPIVLSGL